MLQTVIVALIVLAAVAYVAWSLWPASSRLRALQRLDASLAPRSDTTPPGWLLRRVVRPLRVRAEIRSGCGACSANPSAPVPPRLVKKS